MYGGSTNVPFLGTPRQEVRQLEHAWQRRVIPMEPLGHDNFIDNLEAHFLGEMERFGASVLGRFRVIDGPDRFVWFRAMH
jgi:hypothetical protein